MTILQNLANEFHPVDKPAFKYEKTCVCGNVFQVKKCYLNNPNKKYCSNACRHKNARTPIKATIKNVTCANCKKIFEMSLGNFNQKFINRYCSKECSYAGKLKGEMRKCLNCKRDFYSRKSDDQKCCSKKCNSILNPKKGFISKVNNSGESNGKYVHGKYVGRKRAGGDTNKKKVREKVIKLDGDWCLYCGKPSPGLHLHRIIYGSHGGKYEVGNCVQLCGDHHELIHKSKITWEPILQEYLTNRSPRGYEWMKEQQIILLLREGA